MKEGKGRGKEREVPTHLIENSKLSHDACVTKNNKNNKKTGRGETNRMACLWWPSTLTGHGREASCLQSYNSTCRRPRQASGTFVPSIKGKIPWLEDHPVCSRRDSVRRSRSRRCNLCGVFPSIGGTNVPLARRGVPNSFDTYYRIVSN